jgi:hypothetical protein
MKKRPVFSRTLERLCWKIGEKQRMNWQCRHPCFIIRFSGFNLASGSASSEA